MRLTVVPLRVQVGVGVVGGGRVVVIQLEGVVLPGHEGIPGVVVGRLIVLWGGHGGEIGHVLAVYSYWVVTIYHPLQEILARGRHLDEAGVLNGVGQG